MTRIYCICLVITCILDGTFQYEKKQSGSFAEHILSEATSEILKEQNVQQLGSLVNNFIQSGTAKQLGDLLQNVGGNKNDGPLQGLGQIIKAATGQNQEKREGNAGASLGVLQNLGSILNVVKQAGGIASSFQQGESRSNRDDEGLGLNADVLSNLAGLFANSLSTQESSDKRKSEDAGTSGFGLQDLGEIILTATGQNQVKRGGNPGASLEVLQNLGSILNVVKQAGGLDNIASSFQPGESRSKRESEGLGLNANVLSNLVGLFANSLSTQSSNDKKRSENAGTSGFGLADMMSIASNFLGQDQDSNTEDSSMDILQTLFKTFSSFTGPEAEQRAESHSDHSSLLPPYLEKLHIFYDNFVNSEAAKYLLKSLEADKIFGEFKDDSGNFSFSKFGDIIENQSYRRQWIRKLTDQLMSILQSVSNPKLYKKYFSTVQAFFNSFLQSQNFPKKALYDPKRPTETITVFINHAAKKYLDVEVSSEEYVGPIVSYVQDIISTIQSKGKDAQFKELSEKLADTIDSEIIQPLTNVHRAYKFVKDVPQCDRYVFCLLNNKKSIGNSPPTKKLLYKGSSLVAAWFANSNTPFWSLYADIVQDTNCKIFYKEKCGEFHKEDYMTTTEYMHNEL